LLNINYLQWQQSISFAILFFVELSNMEFDKKMPISWIVIIQITEILIINIEIVKYNINGAQPVPS